MKNRQSWYADIRRNTALRFIDSNNNTVYSLSDLENLHLPKQRGLAFLYVDTSLASVQMLLNIYRSEWAVVLLNPALKPAQKEQLEKAYRPGLIYDPGRQSVATYMAEKLGENHTCFLHKTPSNYPLHPNLRLMLTTSGSTGSPKLVKLSEENIRQNAHAISSYLPILSTDTVPLNLPLFYAYGLSVLHANMLRGGHILCTTHDVMQARFWDMFSQYKCSSVAGVPYVYDMLDRIGFREKKYVALRYLTQAGGKMPENLRVKWAGYAAEKAIPFYVMYGQTEATARMAYLAPKFLAVKTASIGQAIPGGEFRIDKKTAELLYYGPNVFGGYAQSADDLAGFDPPPYLATGDLARVDDDGFYYITGRIKRMVKLFGTRINLDEVEDLLNKNWPQNRFLCTGYEDKLLYVYFTGYILESVKHIGQFLRAELGIHPAMIRMEHISDIPLNANGKPHYSVLPKS